ncbi:hypothetical protein J2T61_000530 [Methanocalculus sp. AMF5]|nr:hypothetical protein [Methanocalculus sp. AMF5]MCP1661866.1 hypothetical protein [Methanocalculus sp. AMF5]
MKECAPQVKKRIISLEILEHLPKFYRAVAEELIDREIWQLAGEQHAAD